MLQGVEDYEIELEKDGQMKFLGSGSFGKVYRGKHIIVNKVSKYFFKPFQFRIIIMWP